jgi:tRNA (guanosine-2'-O-)-methyltransferase
MKQLGYTDLKRLHREWSKRSTGRVGLILEALSSPYNVGSIVRTAAAFRVEHIYLAAGAASPSSARAAKTAMGTERYLSWSHFERGPEAADAAREDGFSVVGLELADQAVPIFHLSAGTDVCLVLGHEDHGLSPAMLAACDAVAFIPQLGRVGSLNVASAAAIGLFELRRREWQGTWAP